MPNRVLRLRGGRIACGPDESEFGDLTILDGRILKDGARGAGTAGEIDLTGHLILPGLINAHDHLEFSVFPRLGDGHYRNATEWASHIYRPEASPVKELLTVPKSTRLVWGGIRNLLSGVTTVAHHNPFDEATFGDRFPVRVLREFGWAHSLAFSGDLEKRFADTPDEWPFLVHAAEGTDERAGAEIGRLDEMGVLGPRTVIVHANGAGPDDLDLLQARGCGIVWCPTSNLATYGRTLSRGTLRSPIPVALGTDSALTAGIDMIDEIRVAKEEGGLTDREVCAMVTTQAARILRLTCGEGEIRPGGRADLIAVKDHGQSPAEAILNLHPEVVIVAGQVRLMATSFAGFGSPPRSFHRIVLERRGEWWIDAPIRDLIGEAVAATGSELRLAGKLVSS